MADDRRGLPRADDEELWRAHVLNHVRNIGTGLMFIGALLMLACWLLWRIVDTLGGSFLP